MYGPVRTVVWQGSAGDRRPYADQTAIAVNGRVLAPGGVRWLVTDGNGTHKPIRLDYGARAMDRLISQDCIIREVSFRIPHPGEGMIELV